MKYFILGLLTGLIIGGGAVYAAERLTLQTGAGVEAGTAASPLYVTQ